MDPLAILNQGREEGVRLGRAEILNSVARATEEARQRALVYDSPNFLNALNDTGDNTTRKPRPIYTIDHAWKYSNITSPKRRPDSLVDLTTLRALADTYDPMRACILQLKREVKATPIKIRPRDTSADPKSFKTRVESALEVFSRKGALGSAGRSREEFEDKILEDALVIGCLAVYKVYTLGGQIVDVLPIDASTIKPVVDPWGWDPDGPTYEQWVWGMKIGTYSGQELVYRGMNARSWSPYYIGPIEWLIGTVTGALKADEWNRAWLTDGDTPSDMIALPEDWTAEEIRTFQEYWQALLSGDVRERSRTRFLPSGSQKLAGSSREDMEFSKFEEWLVRRVHAVFGVSMTSTGYSQAMYRGSEASSLEHSTRYGTGSLLELRREIYNDLLSDFGFGELEVIDDTDRDSDAASRGQRLMVGCGGPWLTVNEAREEEGKQPIAGEEYNEVREVGADPNQSGNGSEHDKAHSKARKKSLSANRRSEGEVKALTTWYDKAKRRLERSGSAACEFVDPELSEVDRVYIGERLEGCASVANLFLLFSHVINQETHP